MTRSERIEAAARALVTALLNWKITARVDGCRDDLRAALASEEGAGRGRAYESLLRVAEKYAAFCWQAGVEADASSLDPAEQLHAQALAAIQRAKVSR